VLRFRLMVKRGPHLRLKHQKEKRGMAYFAGLDVSVKETSVCIVDDAGKIVREARVASEPEALPQVLTNTIYRFKRIGLEAGPLSQWLYSVLTVRRRDDADDALRSGPEHAGWAMKVARHRGMKKAIVALARRLAVMMHRVWVDGTEFRWTREVAAA
jgi:hypothetical protein